tara:strand:+ start:897 stop:1088 length:192 start_codon:yes stop_codon:yes gene_type:complete
MLRRSGEAESNQSSSQMDILKRDMADLTKSYYDVLKRNDELYNQVRELESRIIDLHNTHVPIR